MHGRTSLTHVLCVLGMMVLGVGFSSASFAKESQEENMRATKEAPRYTEQVRYVEAHRDGLLFTIIVPELANHHFYLENVPYCATTGTADPNFFARDTLIAIIDEGLHQGTRAPRDIPFAGEGGECFGLSPDDGRVVVALTERSWRYVVGSTIVTVFEGILEEKHGAKQQVYFQWTPSEDRKKAIEPQVSFEFRLRNALSP